MNRTSAVRVSAQASVVLLGMGLLTYSLYATEQYLSSEMRQVVGWVAFAIFYAIYRFANRFECHESFLRVGVIILSAFLAVRYIMWRTFDTLYYTGPFDFIGLALLYLAECHTIALHLLGMFINAWPLRRRIAPVALDDKNLPTVDIFIPTYSESEEITRVTATAAAQMRYPADKLRIHILDDGGTQARRRNPATAEAAWNRYYSLRKLAVDLGVNYITMETNKHAKAGNINHALRITDGDLVVVLDCDHVPTSDLLENTVGMFARDEKLFLVQTPHFFINPTPVEKQLEGVGSVSVENDMFFRLIHLGLDFWNSSYFCGSAAIISRKHLMDIGGIATYTITEDAETALILHNKGLNSAYIDRPMVCGLSPETFSDYVIQRTRWAQGMLQLFMLRNALVFTGLSMFQKVCYFNSSFFWFFGMSRFIFYIAPTLYLIFGLRIYHASVGQILAYAVPYVLSVSLTMDFFFGKVRKPFFSEIYESVQALFLIPALISVILNPFKPTFKITPKGGTIDTASLNPLAAPFFIVVSINVISIPMAIYTWINYPLYRDVVLVTAAWCVFNIFLAVVALGAFWEKKQVRRHHRIKAYGSASVFFTRMKQTVEGELKDVSLKGLSVEVSPTFNIKLNDDVELTVSDSYGET
ncbi:MAG: UDP-forming cellulose synthase catalytic subunit, partial [Nitrospinae bacterium]|nr:UDP-forming cellulose synthase catalytic subunit [Nitrospinota bacterium]